MYLIHAKGVYNHTVRGVEHDGLVVVEDRIEEIGDYRQLFQRWGKQATVLDLQGLYLCPGLVNTHVHLEFDSTTFARSNYMRQSPQVRMGRALAQAQQMLLSGVTTVRDAGSSWEMLDITDSSLAALYKLPKLQLCGPPITITGGHLSFMHCEANTREEIVKSVRSHQKRGCTAIKMMITGGQMTPGSGPERESYSVEEIRALTQEAYKLGLPTLAHCLTTGGFVNSLQGGIDSIEHCACFVRNQTNHLLERVYEDSIMNAYRGQNRYFMNGLSAGYHAFDQVRSAGAQLPDKTQSFLLEQESRMFAIFNKIVGLGLKPVVGTDAGVSYTYFDESWLELELMCGRGGLSPAEVVEAATINGAGCLGLDKEIGRLERGFKADVIGLRFNPIDDIRSFRSVEWIMRDGEIVKQGPTKEGQKL